MNGGDLPDSPPPLGHFDDAVTTALQSALPAALRPALDAASLFGGTVGWILLVGLAFWCSGSRLGIRVALLTSVSSLLNVVLKWAVGHPRPYFVSDRIVALQPSDGFGMPSGHAQGSATVWGALARWGSARWLWVAGALVTFLAGFVRVYYGVHSVLQVTCGWLLGALLVLMASAVEAPLERWWARAGPAARWAAVVLPPLGLFGAGLLLRHLLFPGWETPADWLARHRSAAIRLDPMGGSTDLLLIDVGGLARWAGALLGASLAAHHYTASSGRHLVVTTWPQRALNTALGIAAMAAVLVAGEMLIRRAGASTEFLRFAALFWVSGVVVPRAGERLERARQGGAFL